MGLILGKWSTMEMLTSRRGLSPMTAPFRHCAKVSGKGVRSREILPVCCSPSPGSFEVAEERGPLVIHVSTGPTSKNALLAQCWL